MDIDFGNDFVTQLLLLLCHGLSDQISNPLFYTTSMGLKKGRFAAIIPIVLHYHNRFKLSYELKATVLKILRKKFVSENFLSLVGYKFMGSQRVERWDSGSINQNHGSWLKSRNRET